MHQHLIPEMLFTARILPAFAFTLICFLFVLVQDTQGQGLSEFDHARQSIQESVDGNGEDIADDWGGLDDFDENGFERARPFQSDFEDMPLVEQVITIVLGLAVFSVLAAITIFETWLHYDALKKLPPDCRLMEPAYVWLKLIPCFHIIWMFFVFNAVTGSYENFFTRYGVGKTNYGRGIGIAYCVCSVLCSIPCLNYCTVWVCGPAAFILVILFHVQLYGFKGEINYWLQQRAQKMPNYDSKPF